MKKVLKWSAIVFGVLLAIGMVASIGDEGTGTESVKTAEPAPSETKEAPKLTPEQELTDAIQKIDSDAEVQFLDGFIRIVAPYEIVTKKMIFSATQVDVVDTLEAVSKSKLLTDDVQVQFSYMGELVDKLGNESKREVIGLGYSAERVREINFSSFLIENVYEVADVRAFIHPAIR